MNLAYRVAVICGASPLLAGVSVFLLWLTTRWQWLEGAGACVLCGGVGLFFVGVLALARFCWPAFQSSDLARGRVRLSTLACACLLLSNFPVAGGIIAAVSAIEERYTVLVYNGSKQPLDDVRVFGGGCDEFLGSIRPGGIVETTFRIKSDGSLKFRARIGTTAHTTTIDGYVTGGLGGATTVTVNADGFISGIRD